MYFGLLRKTSHDPFRSSATNYNYSCTSYLFQLQFRFYGYAGTTAEIVINYNVKICPAFVISSQGSQIDESLKP